MLAKFSLNTEAGWHTLSSLSHAMGGLAVTKPLLIWSHHIFPSLAKPYHMCIAQQLGEKLSYFLLSTSHVSWL